MARSLNWGGRAILKESQLGLVVGCYGLALILHAVDELVSPVFRIEVALQFLSQLIEEILQRRVVIRSGNQPASEAVLEGCVEPLVADGNFKCVCRGAEA